MAIPEVFQKVCSRNGWSCEGNQAEVALEGGRKQKVFLETFVHESDQMARAFTKIGDIGAESGPRMESALSLNFSLPHGALAINEDQLVVTDTFLLKDADADEIEASVSYLAETADRYEKFIYRTDQH